MGAELGKALAECNMLSRAAHTVLRRHNNPDEPGYIHETHRLVPSYKSKEYGKKLIGLSIKLTPLITPPKDTWRGCAEIEPTRNTLPMDFPLTGDLAASVDGSTMFGGLSWVRVVPEH